MQKYTWFYTLTNELSGTQLQNLQNDFQAFVEQWKSHGRSVTGLIQVKYNKFIIIQSDPSEERPSGCSIDSLKRGVGSILQHHGLETLDAAYVCYKDAQGNIAHTHFSKLGNLVEAGDLIPQTIIFDHSLSQSDDLSKWEVRMDHTWLKRYLPKRTEA